MREMKNLYPEEGEEEEMEDNMDPDDDRMNIDG